MATKKFIITKTDKNSTKPIEGIYNNKSSANMYLLRMFNIANSMRFPTCLSADKYSLMFMYSKRSQTASCIIGGYHYAIVPYEDWNNAKAMYSEMLKTKK